MYTDKNRLYGNKQDNGKQDKGMEDKGRQDKGKQDKGMLSNYRRQNRKPEIRVEDIVIEIERKKIKNLHLRVYPPDGLVRISAPMRFSDDMIHSFAASKIGWIRKHQARIREKKIYMPLGFTDGEPHLFKGRSCRLMLIEQEAKPYVEVNGDTLRLYIRPGADAEKRRAVMDEFYRQQLRQDLPGIIDRWAKEMHVSVGSFGIKKMKTKWGTCNRKARRIWINLELAKKPPECLEYIVVHELVHLLERYHNSVFYSYMDRFLPQWRIYKKILNS
jgi:predicted metal-dependent hydrolase